MKTVNDVALTAHQREIHRAASRLDYLTREGMLGSLVFELAKLENAARQAGWIVLELERQRRQK